MDRTNKREGIPDASRIRLLESDLDEIEDQFEKLIASVDGHINEFKKTMTKNTNVLIGILVSVTTASILMVINIATR